MEVDETGEGASEEKEEPKVHLRPNFFVAVQVSNPVIHKAVCDIQNVVVSKEPLYKSVLIKLITLHITLCTLHLPGNDEIKRAISALNKLEEVLKESHIKSPISLKFKGIGSFKNEVVFAKVEPGEPLTQLGDMYDCLTNALKDEGFTVVEKFMPHLTIMKMSKDRSLRKKKIFKIPKTLYDDKGDMDFGDQTIRSIQLLRMGGHASGSYYKCYHNIDMGMCDTEMEDHHGCCGVQSVIPKDIVDLASEEEDKVPRKRRKLDKLKSEKIKSGEKACESMSDAAAVNEAVSTETELGEGLYKNGEHYSSKEKLNLEALEITGQKTDVVASEVKGTCDAEMVDDQFVIPKCMVEETRKEGDMNETMSDAATAYESINKEAKRNKDSSKIDESDANKEKLHLEALEIKGQVTEVCTSEGQGKLCGPNDCNADKGLLKAAEGESCEHVDQNRESSQSKK